MSAVRLARAFTGRDEDPQVRRRLPRPRRRAARPGRLGARDARDPVQPRRARRGRRRHPGVPSTTTSTACARLAERHGDDLAAIIVEPVAGNMGVVPPAPGFLEGLRTVCNGTGALLVVDEVITGFRVAYGGGQERLAVRPDLTCLGKIVGGGLPAAAFGGRSDVMAPARARRRRLPGGHPLGEPARDGRRPRDARAPARARRPTTGSSDIRRRSRPALQAPGVTVNRVGAMLTAFFHPGPVRRSPTRPRATPTGSPRFHAPHARRAASTWRRRSSRRSCRRSPTRRSRSSGRRRPRRSSAGERARDVADRAAARARSGRGRSCPRRARASLRFADRCPDRHLLGVEMIYEGYLLHYGRSRLFSQADRDLALLTGDYLYAAGLREICATGDLSAVGALASLISRCARNRATATRAPTTPPCGTRRSPACSLSSREVLETGTVPGTRASSGRRRASRRARASRRCGPARAGTGRPSRARRVSMRSPPASSPGRPERPVADQERGVDAVRLQLVRGRLAERALTPRRRRPTALVREGPGGRSRR